MNEIESRLARLERRNRWLTLSVVALGTILVFAVSSGAYPQVANEIRANRFVVIDDTNNELGSFGTGTVQGEAHFEMWASDTFPGGDVSESYMLLAPQFLSFHYDIRTNSMGGRSFIRSGESATYAASNWEIRDTLQDLLVEAAVSEVSGVPTPYIRVEKGRRALWLLGQPDIRMFDEDDNLIWKALVSQRPTKPIAVRTEGWKDKQNWRLLARRMSKDEVSALLGVPGEITVIGQMEWWYFPRAGGGSVTFTSDKVSGWSEP